MLAGTLKAEVRAALLDSFRRSAEMRIVVSNANLPKPFDNFLAAPGTTYEDALFNLLDWVESQDRLVGFLQAAQGENPGNPKLRAVMAKFAQLEHRFTDLRPDVSFEQAERIVLKGVRFEDVAAWLGNLGRMRRAVCRVEPEQGSTAGYGTGYLVAPDVVMTNFHVAAPFWSAPGKAQQVKLRFGYESQANGVAVVEGTSYPLLLDWPSPRAADDPREHPWQCLASPEGDLDFALLRLSKPAGNDPAEGALRGFLTLTSRAFNEADPMLIVQHPAAAPLKLSFGAVERTDPPHRVLYKVNTEGGSSGSPCLTQDLKVTAIHHYGQQANNRGVTHEAILNHLAGKRGHLKGLGLEHMLA